MTLTDEISPSFLNRSQVVAINIGVARYLAIIPTKKFYLIAYRPKMGGTSSKSKYQNQGKSHSITGYLQFNKIIL